MKTKKLRNNRISILFSLTAILLFSFIGKAQLNLDINNHVGIGTTAPAAALEVSTGNILITKASAFNQIGVTRGSTSDGASLNLNTSTTHDWIIGERSVNGSDLHIYSYGTSTDVMLIQRSNGWVGIGTPTPGYKLDVQGGDINASGSVRSAGVALTSDKKFKTNIATIPDALSIINKLIPSSYYWDTTTNKTYGMSFTSQKQYGLISQDVEKVLPELIYDTNKGATYDSTGKLLTQPVTFKALNYIAFIPIMMKAIQEQQKTIDSLQSQITQIVNNCCPKGTGNRTTQNNDNGSGGNKNIDAINVELSNADVIVLNEAAPNPFAEQTLITFNIPEKYNTAQMLFYDSNGKLIKSVDIKAAGKGQIHVFANDLTNGTYSYTLIVDGKIIDTKRMIKQQ